MYGRMFRSLYEGSMVGAGITVFAVWNYAVTMCRRSRVELNPKHLSLILSGNTESEKDIRDAIEWLCRKDGQSRNKDNNGARLVKEGEYQYFLPSYSDYDKIRSLEDLRAYNRRKQEESRNRKDMAKMARDSMKGRSGPTMAERAFLKEQENNQ